MNACPACGDSVATPLVDAITELLAVLPRVATQPDHEVEQQLRDAIERCHIELSIVQHQQPGGIVLNLHPVNATATPPATAPMLLPHEAWWVKPLIACANGLRRLGVPPRRLTWVGALVVLGISMRAAKRANGGQR